MNQIRNFITWIVWLTVASGALQAQGQTTFAYRYDNGHIGERLLQLPDNGYLIVGGEDGYSHDRYEIWEGADWKRNADIFLMRTDEYSDVIWQRSYGSDTTREHGMWVIRDNAGDFVIAGCRTREMNIGSPPAGDLLDSSDVLLLKVDAAGNLLWSRVFDTGGDDWAYSVVQTQDGGYLLSCFNDSIPLSLIGNTSIMLIKTDVNGNLEWERKYQNAIRDFDTGKAFTYVTRETRDKGFITVGATFNTHQSDLYVMRLDSNADVVWAKSYDHFGPQNNLSGGYDVWEAFDSTFMISGFMDRDRSSGFLDELNFPYALHLDDTGKVIRPQYFTYMSFRDKTGFSSLYQCADSHFVFCGKAGYGISGEELVMARTDDSLNLDWGKHYSFGGPMLGGARDIKPTSDGGYILGGIMSFHGISLLKTDAAGEIACHAAAPVSDSMPLITTVYYNPDTASGISVNNWPSETDSLTEDSIANCTVQIPLPVEIPEFSAVSLPDGEVLLTWKVASLHTTRRFVIERSTDGRQFEPTGYLDREPGTRGKGKLSFLDRPGMTGRLYYRLRQEDLDGGIHYSGVREVALGDLHGPELRHRWQPEGLELYLSADAPAGLSVVLRDLQGRALALMSRPDYRAGNGMLLSAPGLSAGVYVLEIRSDDFRPIRLKIRK